MAATVTPGNRGVAGVSSSKSLFLIFSLLSLVHVATSLIDQDHLEILEEYFENGINEAAKKKAVYDYVCIGATNLFQSKLQNLLPTLEQLKADVEKFPRLQGLTTLIDAFLEKKINEFTAEIEARQSELRDIWEFIKLREIEEEDDEL